MRRATGQQKKPVSKPKGKYTGPYGAVVFAVDIPPNVQITDDTTVAALSMNIRLRDGDPPQIITVPLTPSALATLGSQVSRALLSQIRVGAALLTHTSPGHRVSVRPVTPSPDNSLEAE